MPTERPDPGAEPLPDPRSSLRRRRVGARRGATHPVQGSVTSALARGVLAGVVLAGWLVAGPTVAQDGAAGGAPMSAIDWLSQSVATPAVMPPPAAADVAEGAAPAAVSVAPLDAPRLDAAGLLPTAVTGLPRGLWGATPTAELVRLIGGERVEAVPALQDLLFTLLIAELDPPHDSAGDGALFLARVDKLLDLGALDQARALLELVGGGSPAAFRRWFDVALLLGEEDRACETMRLRPDVAPTFPARVFCLARGGDWNAAALVLRTGEALGHVSTAEADLMARFLDPDLHEDDPALPVDLAMTPLTWRVLDAIGEPVPTQGLPVAFAHADLRANAGWKAQIEAAERLARLGAVPGNRLLGLYTTARPSASGGVWDRVQAVQAFDAALATAGGGGGGTAAVSAALRRVWPLIGAADLEVPFAELYGGRLRVAGLTGEDAVLALEIGLLSADYEEIANAVDTAGHPRLEFLAGLARGQITGLNAPGEMARAIARGFAAEEPPESLARMIAEDRLGEALLRAMKRLAEGAAGDLRAVSDGIALMRHIGLEDAVRRTALQLMLLDRRG